VSINILLAFLYFDEGYFPLAEIETGSYLPGPGVVFWICIAISSGRRSFKVKGEDFKAEGN
jgi:hypothetical protein